MTSVGAVGLINPFSRASAGNFMVVPGAPAETITGGGAFPNGMNWATNPWARFQ